MPFKPDGNPDLSPKQDALLKLCRAHTGLMKFILMIGTRLAGKTQGAQNAIASHLWNTKHGSVLVLCYTAGAAATSGIWNELTEKVLPEWIAQNFGMEWHQPPKVHGATKKMLCSIRNKYYDELGENGGISKLELDSLDDEREVEKKYKSRYYSMIYWSEAGEFVQELSMTTLMMALRIAGLAEEEHILLIDANPPDSGTAHFLYKFFYELRIAREEDCDAAEKLIRRCLHVIEWTMDDNPYVSDERKAITKKMYEKNPALYDRYVLGKWTSAVKDALFADVFAPSIHVSGDIKRPDPLDEMIPNDGCTELIRGHDAGGVNPVSYIIEKVPTDVDGKEQNCFKVLDELAYIGEEILVSDFTLELMEKSKAIEAECTGTIIWKDWADSSALNIKESIAGRSVADEMFAVSDGEIRLVAAYKGSGSVAMRIRLLRKLLIQNRIKINVRCVRLIEMLQSIGRGKHPGTVAAHTKHKHPLDALTYALAMELWDELRQDVMRTRRDKGDDSSGGIIRVTM